MPSCSGDAACRNQRDRQQRSEFDKGGRSHRRGSFEFDGMSASHEGERFDDEGVRGCDATPCLTDDFGVTWK